MKIFAVKSLNYAFFTGDLSQSQKMGIITLIPKGNKNRELLKNWRPISLLNVIYKLASGCIANRLKKVLPHLIHENQKGFLKDRFIGENIRLLYDILLYTEINNVPGMLLIIDFEKAFDSVSHNFLFKVLNFFGFGKSFQNWVKLFYENASSCVLVNGHFTNRFSIDQGCRQGDPLSPYLYLLVSEILGIIVRHSSSLNGLNVNGKTIKLLQYADDTLLTLDGTKNDLQCALKILSDVESVSNLKINIGKTHVVWIGKNRTLKAEILHEYNLNWISEGYFRYLGIDFSVHLSQMVDHNYCEKIKEIKNQMTMWLKRSLTPVGRVTVVKSLFIPKLNYLFLSLPEPNAQILSDLNRCFFSFIWANKPDKIGRKQMCQLYKDDGVKMINIFLHIKSLKLSWLRRFFLDSQVENFNYHMFVNFLPSAVFPKMNMGSDYFRKLSISTQNTFWKEVLLAFIELVDITSMNIASQSLWSNPKIKINNSSIYLKHWCTNGIRFVNDILNSDGTFLSYTQLKNKFDVHINFIQYYGICNAIRAGYGKTVIPKITEPTCIIPGALLAILKRKKGCSHIYQSFLKHREIECKSLLKWKMRLGIEDKVFFSYCLLPVNSSQDISIKWFQYKILNNILYMKDSLYKFKLVPDKNCTFCQNSDETLIHIFCDCPYTEKIWLELEKWVDTKTGFKIKFTNENKLFGLLGMHNAALNCIMIIVRREIYFAKCKNQILSFEKMLLMAKMYYDMEKYIARTNQKEKNFDKKWYLFRKCF